MINMHPRSQGGFALALTLIVFLGVAVIATGALMVAMNSGLITIYHGQQNDMARAAEAALEQARARINADPTLYPDTGFLALEVDAPVVDLGGDARPGLRRTTWVGPTGLGTGEYGVQGSVVSMVKSGRSTVIRRGQVVQESFAKFAYFTDVEPSNIAFGGGDNLFGPVHSNDDLRIYSSGATFHGPVSTAGQISGTDYGQFRQGYDEFAPRIPLPQLADLQKLQGYAQQGGTAFNGTFTAAQGRATTRIEFVGVDLNGDGDNTDSDEGFIRVYQSNDPEWVVGSVPVDDMRDARNCGHYHGNAFVSADDHPTSGNDDYRDALRSGSRRCYLGGDSAITNGFAEDDGQGSWLRWNGPVSPQLAGRADANNLFPVRRDLNADFKGVVYVSGDVAVSGTVRGRLTVAASGDIIIADDIRYAIDPAVGSCEDILGLFAGGEIVVAHNPVNAPWRIRSNAGEPYRTFDDTSSEFIHGFILTLDEFGVEAYNEGASNAEDCESTNWGRGCLYITGGIIQRQRGAVGTSGGTGYLKRYSYDPCGATQPPPYFPTTGRFARSTFYEIAPTDFEVRAFYDMLSAGR